MARPRRHLHAVGDDAEKRGRGRPGKSLQQHLDDGTFEYRKHKELLDVDELVDESELRKLQQRHRRLKTEAKRREVGLEFERIARAGAPKRTTRAAVGFDARLRTLGRSGTAERTINFFEAFYVWDDGSPWRVDPFQKEIIREIRRRNRQRQLIYQEILIGICRGQGKTPLASGLATEELATAPVRLTVRQIAGSKLQASLGTGYATGWVEDSEALQAVLRAETKSVRRRDGRGSYTVLSAQGRFAHGLHGRIKAIADELWLFKNDAEVQGYIALESALHKDVESQLIGISTAGYNKRSLLGRKYKRGLSCPNVETRREGFLTIWRDEAAGFLMWCYGIPEGYELDLEDDRAVLRALKLANPGTWTNHRAMLRSLRRAMNGDVDDNDDIQDVYEWLRLCLNFWTVVRGTWLTLGAWRALKDETLIGSKVEIPRGADINVMVDAAHTYDTTSVSWAWYSKELGKVVTRSKVFSVREGVPAHVYVDEFYDASGERHVAELFIHELADVHGFRVREVVGDPNYFGGELARLGKRFLTAPIYPQSNEMREHVQRFYRDVHGGRIVTDGDPIVTAHVEAIAGEKTTDGYWAIRKLHQADPMDAGTSTIVVNGRAQPDRREVSVYEERGLMVLGGSAPESPVGDGDATSQALPYSRELAELLGLPLGEDDIDLELDEEEDEWDD
jgi:phage terminase large subunit-like protein